MAKSNVLENNQAHMAKAEEDLKSAFDKYGMEGIKKHFEDKLEEWKDVPLYVGITGRSGVGKSSFINAIRGLEAEDVGAAAIGVIETTSAVEQYPHPKNKQLVLCDLPGVGTPTFSKDTYFTDERIGFDKFDMFLILTCDRFYEDDLWLAKGIMDRKKSFLFIRTKIGQDVENDKRARKSHYEQNPDAIDCIISKIRINCEKSLPSEISNKGAQTVFLLDSYDIDNPLFDMNDLTEKLIKNFPDLKRDAFILSLSANTPSIIEAKEKVLRERFGQVCIISALGGAIPIPGVSLVVDVNLMLKEAKFYRDQLGLDEATLKQTADNIGMSWKKFKDATVLKSFGLSFTQSGIIGFCSSMVMSEVVEKWIGLAIPAIGSIVGAGISYWSLKYALEKLLNLIVDDAKRVSVCITEASVESVGRNRVCSHEVGINTSHKSNIV